MPVVISPSADQLCRDRDRALRLVAKRLVVSHHDDVFRRCPAGSGAKAKRNLRAWSPGFTSCTSTSARGVSPLMKDSSGSTPSSAGLNRAPDTSSSPSVHNRRRNEGLA